MFRVKAAGAKIPSSRRGGALFASVILTSLALLALTASSYRALAAEPRAADKAAELEQLRQRMQSLDRSLAKDRDQKTDLQAELRAIEQKMARARKELTATRHGVRERDNRLRKLQGERKQEHAATAAQREALAGELRSAYLLGRQGVAKMVLNQQDPAQLGRHLVYYDYLSTARIDRIDDIETRLARLAELEQAIAAEAGELRELQRRQGEQEQALKRQGEERAAVLARLDAEIGRKGRELARLQENERRLERLLESLRRAPPPAQPAPRHAVGKGTLPWPARGPLVGRFGERHSPNGLKRNGVLIRAAAGEPVQAVAPGRVVFADWLVGYGMLTIVDHGNGLMSLYGYNQSLQKSAGASVTAGEVIARVGESGDQVGAGLYFEIRHRGKPTDPLLWCKGETGR